jgi:hypothetical protein
MLDIWVPCLAASTALAASVFVVVAMLWLKKLRATVQATMREIAGQQVCNAQRMSDCVGNLRKQQQSLEQQLHDLSQSSVRLRQEMVAIAARIEMSERGNVFGASDRIFH